MKKAIITVSIIAVVAASLWFLRRSNPGIYLPYKCKPGSDFYGDNWKARGAVCAGLYIPYSSMKFIKGKDKTQVLEWMLILYGYDPVTNPGDPQYKDALTNKTVLNKLVVDAASNV